MTPSYANPDPRLLDPGECEELAGRVLEMAGVARAQVEISSGISAVTRFARGDSHVASETGSVSVQLLVEVGDRHASGLTNQVDEAGLRALVRDTRALAMEKRTHDEWNVRSPQVYPEGPPLFFDASLRAMPADAHAIIVGRALDAAEAAALTAAGDLELAASVRAAVNTAGLWAYERATFGELSLTARTADGTGSGWAWSGYEDWARVDVEEVIRGAVTLGQRSASPAAIEPGRYTVILEPAAVAELVHPIIGNPTAFWSAEFADGGAGPFANEPRGTNKIGLQMLDSRIRMVSDPWDAERPGSTITADWTPITGPVEWFQQGVLRNLAYHSRYARQLGRERVINPGGVRLAVDGPAQTRDEMIASTRRGVWVNRLSHVAVMDGRTLLLTGTTRDGTFLIENGRITRPIKNFRFTESPFFVFNQLEAWGEPIRASRAVVAPRLKLRDFNFTSLSDAI